MVNRRSFIKILLLALTALSSFSKLRANVVAQKPSSVDTTVTVYRAINGSPSENVSRIFEMMGGIQTIIDKEDVVIVKPNVQWWNQSAPNLEAVETLVDLIMNRAGGFQGEVVLAENVHRGNMPWDSSFSGWNRYFDRNGGSANVNHYNDLCRLLKKRYSDQFTVVHWINVGFGAKRVYMPSDGDGYVYCDGSGGVEKIEFHNGAAGANARKTIMTYPIFTTDRGTRIDFKNGVWKGQDYSDRRMRFVNIAGINHHSTWCGVTGCVKNFLGVTDLSGGPDPDADGKLTGEYYNFHAFPFDHWAPGPQPGMLGAEVGAFLSTIRRADLHITTADWVGLASRTEPPVVRTKAVLASTDPVALDYHACKYILHANSHVPWHDPDQENRPTAQYLRACAEHGGGIFDERQVAVHSYDANAGRMQNKDELAVFGRIEWGSHMRTIAKYLLMRYASFLL